MTWFATYLVLWTEFSTCQSPNLKRRWLDLFWKYYHIQYDCNRSHLFLLQSFILPHFWHIQNLSVNKGTMPLTLVISCECLVIGLSYFTCVFLVTKHLYWDLNLWSVELGVWRWWPPLEFALYGGICVSKTKLVWLYLTSAARHLRKGIVGLQKDTHANLLQYTRKLVL
jgi:hypothetical protein